MNRGGSFSVLLSLACFAFLTWGGLRFYPQDYVTVSIRLKSENRFVAEVFWSDEADGRFDRSKTMSKVVERGAVRECSFRIPHQAIRRLRLDFGNNPGPVEVYGVSLCGDKVCNLDLRQFTFSKDVETHTFVDGKGLLLQSRKADPFMVYVHPLDIAPAFMPEWTVIIAGLAIAWLFAVFLSTALVDLFRKCKKSETVMSFVELHPLTISDETSNKIRNLGFVCSVFVVVMHASPGFRPMVAESWSWCLFSAFEIAVPFFFFVSGYLLVGRFGEKGWFQSALSKRLTTLVVPFVIWSVLYVLFRAVMLFSLGKSSFGTLIIALTGKSEYLGLNPVTHPMLAPLWYVRALLFFVVASPVFLWVLMRRKWSVLVGAFLFSVFCPRYQACAGDFSYTLVYFLGLGRVFYFLVGMSFRLGLFKIPKGRWMNVLGWCGVCALLIYNAAALCLVPENAVMNKFSLPIVNLSLPFLMFFAWLIIPCNRWPRWLTSMTFPIYIVHWFALEIHARLFFRDCETFCQMIFQCAWGIVLTMGIVAVLRLFPKKVYGILFGGR